MMTSDANIAAQIKRLLDSLEEPVLAPFLAEWPRNARQRAVAAASLPVLRWLADIAGDAAAFGIDLVGALCRDALTLAWRQTYSADDLSAAFLDNYGWTEIVGGNGPLESERVACGFLLLGPATHYPRHRHEAEEVYLPLSGTAAWQQGDSKWRERSPGTVIHHSREEPHAMRTGAGPLLALYLWRSANLAQKARLEL
jgi:Dimethlysulfonioproprionate lyase